MPPGSKKAYQHAHGVKPPQGNLGPKAPKPVRKPIRKAVAVVDDLIQAVHAAQTGTRPTSKSARPLARQLAKAYDRQASQTAKANRSVATADPYTAEQHRFQRATGAAKTAAQIEDERLRALGHELGLRTTGTDIAEGLSKAVVSAGELALLASPGGAPTKIVEGAAKKILEGGAKTAAKSTFKKGGSEAVRAAKRLEKAIVKGERRKLPKGVRAKQATKRQAKKRRPAVTIKEGRRVLVGEKTMRYGVAGPGVLGAAGAVATNLGTALKEHPGETLKTTANTLPSIATAPIGMAVGLAQGHVGEVVKENIDYLKLLNDLAGDPHTPVQVGTDSKGQAIMRTPSEIIAKDTGLTPGIAAGLFAFMGTKAGRSSVSKPSLRERSLQRAYDRATTPQERQAINAKGRGLIANRKDRAGVAQMVSAAGDEAMGTSRRDLKTAKTGRALQKGSGKKVGSVKRGGAEIPITVEQLAADVLEHGFPLDARRGKPLVDEVIASVMATRERRPPAHEPDGVTNLDTLRVLSAKPKLLEDKTLGRIVEGRRASAPQVGIARAELATGAKQAEGLAEDRRAAAVPQARTYGVPLSEEAVPLSIRSITRHEPTAYVEAKPAIRREASADVKAAGSQKRGAAKSARKAEAEARLAARKAREAQRHHETFLTEGTRAKQVAVSRQERTSQLAEALALIEERITTTQRESADPATLSALVRQRNEVRRALATHERNSAVRRDAVRVARAETRAAIARRRSQGASRSEEAAYARIPAIRKKAEAQLSEAARIKEGAQAKRDAVNKLRQAEKLDVLATRMERSGGDVEKVASMRDAAKQLRREYADSEKALLDEMIATVAAQRVKRGADEPTFVRQETALDPLSDQPGGGEGYLGNMIGKREVRRTGALGEMGHIRRDPATFTEGIVKQRFQIAWSRLMQSFVSRYAVKDANGAPRIYESFEAKQAQRNGEIPAGHVPIAVQEIARAFQSGEWLEGQGKAELPFNTALRETRGLKGRKYIYVPRAAREEFKAQSVPMQGAWVYARAIGRTQSVALLGLSLSWAAAQTVATPLIIAARHSNPARWAKAGKGMVDLYRGMDPHERDLFDSWLGATTSDVLEMRDVHVSGNRKTTSAIATAYRKARLTPGGRLMMHLKRGGPLIAGVATYEKGLRRFNALLELDRMGRESRRPEMHRFANSIAELDATTQAHIAAVSKLPLKEQVEFYNRKPELQWELSRRQDDAIGNWSALTAAEKKASALMIFYPFLRFSLRWTLYSFPKNNPAKAALLANLSQINTIQLDQLNEGEDLGNMFAYGQVHVPGSDTLIDTHRFAPGSNALIEAMGGSRNLGQTLTSPLSPWIGQAASVAFGQDPYTGDPLEDTSPLGRLTALLKGQAALPPPLRAATTAERGPWSQLLTALRGNPTSEWTRAMVPDVIASKSGEAAAAHAGKLMTLVSEAPTFGEVQQEADPAKQKVLFAAYEAAGKARDELERLLVQFGIQTVDEQRQATKDYERSRDRAFGLLPQPKTTSASTSSYGGGGSSYSGSYTSSGSYGR